VSVLISGCTDKENTATEVVSSEQDYCDLAKVEIEQERYELIKEQNYPTLERVDVEINNPNVELVGSYFADTRTYEGDSKWVVYIVVQNNGKDGVWIGKNIEGLYKNTPHAYKYDFLGSGEIKTYLFSGHPSAYLPLVTLDNLLNGDITFKVNAYDTTTPIVSSIFGQFYLEYTTIDPEYMINIESIKYKVDDNGWKYIVFETNNPTSVELNGSIGLHVLHAIRSFTSSEDCFRTFTLSPGESKTIEMCLRNNNLRNLEGISFSTKV